MPQVFVQGFAEPPRSKAETIMGGLSDVIGALNERKAKNEAELQDQLRMLFQYPQLADTLGEDIKSKWGRKKPEIASMVTAMQNKNKLARDADASQNAWASAVAAEEKRRYEMQMGINAMPDKIQTTLPGPMMGGPFGMSVPAQMPNQGKQEAAKALAGLDDAQYVALMKMDPKQRELVIAQRMRDNKSIPQSIRTPLDKSKMDELTRTLLSMGMTQQDVLELYRVKFGLKVAPAVIEKDLMDDQDKLADIDAKETHAKTAYQRTLDEIKAREEASTRLENLQHGHMMARGEAGGWGGGGEGGGVSKITAQTNQDAVEEVLGKYAPTKEPAKKDQERIDMLTRAMESSPEKSKDAAKQALDDAKKEVAQRERATTIPPAVRAKIEREITGLYNDMDKVGASSITMGTGRGALTKDMILQLLINQYLSKVNSGEEPSIAEAGLDVAISKFRSLYRPQK
jgi:hypothetical protein